MFQITPRLAVCQRGMCFLLQVALQAELDKWSVDKVKRLVVCMFVRCHSVHHHHANTLFTFTMLSMCSQSPCSHSAHNHCDVTVFTITILPQCSQSPCYHSVPNNCNHVVHNGSAITVFTITSPSSCSQSLCYQNVHNHHAITVSTITVLSQCSHLLLSLCELPMSSTNVK